MKVDTESDPLVSEVRKLMPIKMQDAIARHYQDNGLGDEPDWVELLSTWPVDEIIAIKGVGKLLMRRLARKCKDHPRYHRIWEEWQHSRENPYSWIEVEGERISMAEIRRYRRMRAVMAQFGFVVDYGEGFGESWRQMTKDFDEQVTDEQVAALIKTWIDESRTPDKIEVETRRSVAPLVTENTITALTQRYLKSLRQEYDVENAPLNDQLQLQHMAELMAHRTFHDQKARDLMIATSGNFGSSDLADEYSWLRKQIADLDNQIIRIQKELGITPEGRTKVQGTRQAWEEIHQLIEDTQELRAREIHHWGDGETTWGYGVWYLPTDEFMPRCAECGCKDIIAPSPNGQTMHIHFATEATRRAYSEARRFVPPDTRGAPEGVFDASTEKA